MSECYRCGKDMFKIERRKTCTGCEYNPVHDEVRNEWTTNRHVAYLKGQVSMVESEGECEFGAAFGLGCYLFKCNNCGHQFNVAMMSG